MLLGTTARAPEQASGTTTRDPFAACALALQGGLAGNTERALRADLAIFAAWCAGRGAAALPASPETVAAFVEAMAETRAPATVRRYVASIAVLHRTG